MIRRRDALGWLLVLPAVMTAVLLLAPDESSAGESPGDTARGQELFQANCAMCHGSDATGMMGMHPALRGAVDRLTAEGVEVTIRNGRDTRPPMPAFGGRLGDDDIADLIAYLEALPPGPRNFGPEGANGPIDNGPMGRMMGGGIVMVLWTLLLVSLIALSVAGTVRFLRRGRRGESSAREQLDVRYARGEFDREDYLQRRRDLEGQE